MAAAEAPRIDVVRVNGGKTEDDVGDKRVEEDPNTGVDET